MGGPAGPGRGPDPDFYAEIAGWRPNPVEMAGCEGFKRKSRCCASRTTTAAVYALYESRD